MLASWKPVTDLPWTAQPGLSVRVERSSHPPSCLLCQAPSHTSGNIVRHNKTFEQMCDLLVIGSITFAVFAQKTDRSWQALATYLLQRWPTPAAVTPEDVKQELLMSAWRFAESYDPSRGVSAAQFLTWNSVDKAKKWIHAQRGANRHGSSDRSPSRFDVALSTMERRDQERKTIKVHEPSTSTEDLEDILDRKIRIEKALAACACWKERVALEAFFRQETSEGAAEEIYTNPSLRLRLRLSCQEAAVKLVKNSISRALQRAA